MLKKALLIAWDEPEKVIGVAFGVLVGAGALAAATGAISFFIFAVSSGLGFCS